MKTEINGYPIYEYNQYHLKDGARYSTCPLCSSNRSRSHRKTKCASLDWNRGLGTCHHCGEVFQLHTYKKKEDLKPYYAYESNSNGTTTYFHEDGSKSVV